MDEDHFAEMLNYIHFYILVERVYEAFHKYFIHAVGFFLYEIFFLIFAFFSCFFYRPLRIDSALRTLSTLRGLRGAPEVPPLCREMQSLGQQMLNAPLGINGICYPT